MFGWLADSPIFNLIAPQVKTKEEEIVDSVINGDLIKFEELKYTVKLHDISKDNNKLLHMACYYGHLDIIKSLLQQGCDINEFGRNGNTPLHFAVSKGHKNISEFLLVNGADVNLKNSEGKIPYDICPLASLKQLLVTYMFQRQNNIIPNNLPDTQSTPISPPPTEFNVITQPIPSQLYTVYPSPFATSTHNYDLQQDLHLKFKNEPPSPVSIENYTNPSPINYEPPNNELPSISPLCPPDNISGVQYHHGLVHSTNPVQQPYEGHQPTIAYQQTHQLPTPPPPISSQYNRIPPYNPLDFVTIKKTTPKRFILPDGFISSANDKTLQKKYGNNVQPVHIAPPPLDPNFQ